jgi:hypothetical protein
MHDEQTAIQAHDEKQCGCLGEASLQTIIWQYKCFIFYSSVFSAGAAAFMAEAEGLIGPRDRGSPQVAVLFSP